MNYSSNFKKTNKILLFFLLSLPFLAVAEVEFIETDLETAQAIAAKENKLFFIYYSAAWCMPCKWMEEHTFTDYELSEFIHTDYIAIKADVSTAGGSILKQQFDVSNIPSVLVFAASGKLIDRKSSSITAIDMLEWLQDLNQAQHHISPNPIAFEQSNTALESPKADIHFQQQNALIPEESALALISEIEEEQAVGFNSADHALAQHTVSFSPRSSLHYGVQIEGQLTYQKAVRAIAQLERKYKHRAELKPLGDNTFAIVLGRFETTGKATELLNYLNRNNITGKVTGLR